MDIFVTIFHCNCIPNIICMSLRVYIVLLVVQYMYTIIVYFLVELMSFNYIAIFLYLNAMHLRIGII